MSKINLTYFFYGAIVFTALAWVFIGVLLLLAFVNIYDHEIVGHYNLFYDKRILLALLPWPALIGFSWLSHALQRRWQSEAAWSIIFLSLMLWVLYALLALYVSGLGILLCTYHANC
jgi:hypothetical protein